MTQQLQRPIDALRGLVTGTIIGPDDADYDEARKLWNAAIDGRPGMVAQCASATDVAAVVTFAVERGLEIAVRCGAHSVSGQSTVDGGIVIDLQRMNTVVVDADSRLARVGGGALLGDIDAAAQEHGLAVPAGLISHTGVAGLTLGGGMGWLARRAGLSIDNIVSAEVVTADGRILRASAVENDDLFWAIRGGGGNFGVVTEFEFQLHQVGPMIRLGLQFWGPEQGGDVLRLARELVPTLSRDLNVVIAAMNAPPAPFVPEEHHNKPGYALLVVGFGSEAEHEELLARIRDELPTVWEFATPMPWVALQQMLDEANAWGMYAYDKGLYIEEFTNEVIDVVLDHLPRKQSPLSVVLFYRLDGAYSAVGDDETAFSGGRSPRYNAFIIDIAPTPELYEADRAWVRGLWRALEPLAMDNTAYVNGVIEADEDHVRAAYGPAKYARLAQVKAKYDPGNVFHRNANIKPA